MKYLDQSIKNGIYRAENEVWNRLLSKRRIKAATYDNVFRRWISINYGIEIRFTIGPGQILTGNWYCHQCRDPERLVMFKLKYG